MSNFDDMLSYAPAEPPNYERQSKEDFAARKQAEREAVFEMSDAAAMDVSTNGDSLRQYLDVQSRFDRHSTAR